MWVFEGGRQHEPLLGVSHTLGNTKQRFCEFHLKQILQINKNNFPSILYDFYQMFKSDKKRCMFGPIFDL